MKIKSIFSDIKSLAATGLVAGVIGGGIFELFVAGQYSDLPGFSDDHQTGRTKNSIASVICGVVGQKMYDGNSELDLEVVKTMWPDANLTGHTTKDTIDSNVDLTFPRARFTASKNAEGNLEGNVDKSEFDWKIKQTRDDTYKIERAGWKLNAELKIMMNDGQISGSYSKPLSFDYKIKGTYDKENGKVDIDVKVALSLDFGIKGNV